MTTRRALLALASTFAAGSLVLAGTAVAQAAGPSGITVREAHNDWTANGRLVLSLTAPTAVKDLKVSLYSMATQQTVATLTDLELASGTAENGTWRTPARIQLPDLGSYRIDVSASDAGGDTLSTTGAGYFYYSVATNLNDARTDRVTVDYEHRTVTISGRLMGEWPGSGDITPMPGLTVAVSSYMQYTQVTTDADGAFSATLPVTSTYQNTINASYPYDPKHVFYNQSSSRDFPIALQKTATRLVETPSTLAVPYKGTVDSTSATLMWDSPDDGWQPLAGKTLGSNSFGAHVERTTDDDGTAVFPATQPLYGNSSISVGWSSDDLYLSDATATADILVVQPAVFQSFTAALSGTGTVAVAGGMTFPSNWTPVKIPVDIQFSATGQDDDWTTVATTPSATWNGQGYAFSATVPVTGTGEGYWRGTFTGTPQFDNAVSQTVHIPAP